MNSNEARLIGSNLIPPDVKSHSGDLFHLSKCISQNTPKPQSVAAWRRFQTRNRVASLRRSVLILQKMPKSMDLIPN